MYYIHQTEQWLPLRRNDMTGVVKENFGFRFSFLIYIRMYSCVVWLKKCIKSNYIHALNPPPNPALNPSVTPHCLQAEVQGAQARAGLVLSKNLEYPISLKSLGICICSSHHLNASLPWPTRVNYPYFTSLEPWMCEKLKRNKTLRFSH